MESSNLTVLYYTSNREDPIFEDKIRKTLVENCGGLPIVSVSQKPIDLGQNICVGDIGCSYESEYKQILEGAKAIKTPYFICAESDFLYPPEYFKFKPEEENVYYYDSIWIVFRRKEGLYYRKSHSDGARICKTDYIIDFGEKLLKQDKYHRDWMLTKKDKKVFFNGEIPCISFKTGNGVRWQTNVMPGDENCALTLPYWGDRNQLRKNYCG